jgi:hypothetical protein
LRVRIVAGDLTVEDLEGNMDIQDHVGGLTIKPGPKKKYDPIDASTRIGDLEGFPGPVVHGWPLIYWTALSRLMTSPRGEQNVNVVGHDDVSIVAKVVA